VKYEQIPRDRHRYKSDPEEVFRAITDPTDCEMVRPEARVDPRVGGEYYFSWAGDGG